MSQVFVRVPSFGRAADDVAQELQLQASTVHDALAAAATKRPELLDLLFTRDGLLHPW